MIIIRTQFTLDEAKAVGNQLGVDWTKIDENQFRTGMNIELEHGSQNSITNVTGDDPLLTGKIAYAHLLESADYYRYLVKMEAEMEGKPQSSAI